MDDLLCEIQLTAERVERFRELHEAAVEDLRRKVTEARAAGASHALIAHAMGRRAALPGRFERSLSKRAEAARRETALDA